MARPVMYRATGAAPVVGSLVRSGMGTRIGRVVAVLPWLPAVWVCRVQHLGTVRKGVWVPSPWPHGRPASYGCSGATGWVQVHLGSGQGQHCVVPVAPPHGAPLQAPA